VGVVLATVLERFGEVARDGDVRERVVGVQQ
jgi:hypothetical protein